LTLAFPNSRHVFIILTVHRDLTTQSPTGQRQASAFQGQGHRLGGSEAPAAANDRRAAQARAVEARKAESDAKFGKSTKSKSTKPTKDHGAAFGFDDDFGDHIGQSSSAAAGRQQGNDNARSSAAAAAEKRAQQGMQGVSSEKAEAMRQRQIKDDLLGRIEHYYKQAGQDVPFGLGSMNVEQLRKHLDYAKSLTQSKSKALVSG